MSGLFTGKCNRLTFCLHHFDLAQFHYGLIRTQSFPDHLPFLQFNPRVLSDSEKASQVIISLVANWLPELSIIQQYNYKAPKI